MNGAQHPVRVALREARHATIERLSDAFARDELGLDEFERRVDAAFDSRSPTELERLVADLVPAGAPLVSRQIVVAAPDEALLVREPSAAPVRVALAVFGSTERRGRWSLPRAARVLSLFGSVELDLRQVVLAPGVTELHLRAVFGNVEVTVSPHVAVEATGNAVLGSFSSVSRVPPDLGDEPLLRIVGSAVFGNVEIHTRPLRSRAE